MGIHQINNIFSTTQIDILKKAIPEYDYDIDKTLGRLRIGDIRSSFTQDIEDTLYDIAKKISDKPLAIDHGLYVEYNSKYGKPNLPPHLDGDTNDLIINMQLESNTSWDIGLNTTVYTLRDNSALVFNGNTEVHWRVHKEFKEDEYVKMIFIRFYNSEKRSDYTHLPLNQDADEFVASRNLRDSLKSA
jgi:hypothetical protein